MARFEIDYPDRIPTRQSQEHPASPPRKHARFSNASTERLPPPADRFPVNGHRVGLFFSRDQKTERYSFTDPSGLLRIQPVSHPVE
ncbi:hypothetical protein [Roseobacter fucihabitans]|uniref:hypothetical protein n=1 Tax=Roseobacter fucihabitans TaxID=1537242 RepID=UPI0016531926|nr:hypothetical protein [Roseobacter litoralis]